MSMDDYFKKRDGTQNMQMTEEMKKHLEFKDSLARDFVYKQRLMYIARLKVQINHALDKIKTLERMIQEESFGDVDLSQLEEDVEWSRITSDLLR